jgi:hypothetical protein
MNDISRTVNDASGTPEENRFGFTPLASGSDAYISFEKSYWDLWRFVSFIVHASHTADELRKTIREIKLIFEETSDKGGGDESALAVFTRELKTHNRFLRDMTVVSAVDNYLAYLKDILYLICRKRPEVLRSNEMVRADFILGYSDMSDLVDALAERKVSDLSYKSFADLSKFF